MPESWWVFTRGSDSIRLVRQEHAMGCRLFLYGPGTETVAYEFGDLTECMRRQAEIEQTLLAEAYQVVQQSSDGRRDDAIWLVPDQRGSAIRPPS